MDGQGLIRPRAGIGVATIELLRAMVPARPDCSITLHLPAGALPPGLPRVNAAMVPGPRFVGRHLLWPLRLSRVRDAVYLGPAGALPLGPLGIPSVVTMNDLAIYRNRGWFPPGQHLSTRVVVPRSLRGATAVIAPSENTVEDLVELFQVDRARIFKVPHGVASAYRPGPTDERLRQRLGLPGRFILFVGTIEPRKNLLTLIEAALAWPACPPVVIAGSWGWECERERTLIESAGDRVRVVGNLEPDDLVGIYRLAAVLAHPAWYEGFGLTLLEAMASGTPVVASSASSVPEVVGEAGITVDPGDVEGWRDSLRAVLEDERLRERLRRAGLERAREFPWSRTAEGTWNVLDRVLER